MVFIVQSWNHMFIQIMCSKKELPVVADFVVVDVVVVVGVVAVADTKK